jgi:hypothetical protein
VLLHHGRKLLDDLDAVGLHPDRGGVPRRMGVLGSILLIRFCCNLQVRTLSAASSLQPQILWP